MYHVIATIQGTRDPANNPPVEMPYYRGDSLGKAISAMTTAAVDANGDPGYVRTLSVRLDFIEPEPEPEPKTCSTCGGTLIGEDCPYYGQGEVHKGDDVFDATPVVTPPGPPFKGASFYTDEVDELMLADCAVYGMRPRPNWAKAHGGDCAGQMGLVTGVPGITVMCESHYNEMQGNPV